MMQYLLLCVVSIICGKGILKILRLPAFSYDLFLSPIVTLSFWTLYLGWGTLLGLPGKILWLPGYMITFLFCCIGTYALAFPQNHKTNLQPTKITLGILLFAVALPILVMCDYFKYGLFTYGGINAPDGWSYVAQGQYLWENMRGTKGQLAPLYQYAAHLLHNRFISAALLGFFSPIGLSAGDTQGAENLFIAWTLFTFISACAFFAFTQQCNNSTSRGEYSNILIENRKDIFSLHNSQILLISIYLLFVLFSGWIFRFLSTNNFDNALVLGFAPAFAGIAYLPIKKNIAYAILLSLLSSAVIYCYIELAPIILGCAAMFFIFKQQRFFINVNTTQCFIIILFITSLLVAPYFIESIHYFHMQLHSALQNANRPGEGFFQVLNHHPITGAWGFAHNNIGIMVLVAVFISLSMIGLSHLWNEGKKNLALVCIALLFAYFIMVFQWHYAYGAYKIGLLNWWLLAFVFIKAIDKIMSLKIKYFHLMIIFLSLLAIVYFKMIYTIQRLTLNAVTIHDISSYRKLSELKFLIGNNAILVNVNDDVSNEWAVYFLRETPIKLASYKVYMAQEHVLPYMRESKYIHPKEIKYQLTDSAVSSKNNLIWESGGYYLWSNKGEASF